MQYTDQSGMVPTCIKRGVGPDGDTLNKNLPVVRPPNQQQVLTVSFFSLVVPYMMTSAYL